MSNENPGSASSRIKQLTESNWNIHSCIHSHIEPLLWAKPNYKPYRERVKNQIVDMALVQVAHIETTRRNSISNWVADRSESHGTPNAYCMRRGRIRQPEAWRRLLPQKHEHTGTFAVCLPPSLYTKEKNLLFYA